MAEIHITVTAQIDFIKKIKVSEAELEALIEEQGGWEFNEKSATLATEALKRELKIEDDDTLYFSKLHINER